MLPGARLCRCLSCHSPRAFGDTDSCDLRRHPSRTAARWIRNRAELEAYGVSRSVAQVRWKNTHASISDTWGQMRPSKSTVYVSTRSCGSAQVTGAIKVSEKCAYAGAS